MSLMQTLFDKIPENRAKNAFRFWVAESLLVPQFLRQTCPLVGYEYLRKIQPSDVIVDAGAFTGDYTVYASRKVGPTGRVLAFEPDPRNLARLRANLRGEIDNVTIIEKGLWNSEGELTFRAGTEGFTSGAACISGAVAGQDLTVKVTRLDSELEKLGISKINVLKMDIEGAELEALKGCEQTLKNSQAYICIASYHILDGENTSKRVEKQLREWGYNTTSAFPCHLTAFGWKPS
ncbi:MAG: FkbM family methyltransferase [bacterium]